MLRPLLVFALPFTTLLANVAPVGAPEPWAAGNRVSLQRIPFDAQVNNPEVKELADCKAAAEQGDREAQTKLGSMYYWGQGAEKDLLAARVWLGRAAEQGQRDAQAKLGAMFFLGQGGAKDPTQALKWFLKAAEQGEPYAQGCIGVLYAVGEVVQQNLLEAYVWLIQANAGGDADAAEPLAQVKARLTPAQIQEGFRRAFEAVRRRSSN